MKKIYFLILLLTSLKCFSQVDSTIFKLRNPNSVSTAKGYSHAVDIDLGNCRMVIISGQVAIDSIGSIIGKGDLRKQAEQVFTNIKSIVVASGGSMKNVVKLGIYMIDITKASTMREVRDKFFNQSELPTSTLVQVSRLVQDDLLLEIEATAIIPQKKRR